MKKSNSRRIAVTAVFTAFSAVFLYLASVLPTGQLGFLGVASLFVIAAVVEYGIAGGVFVFAGTAILGLLIVPSKSLVLIYALFFGWYPLMKSLAERAKSRAVEWVVKLAAFNAAAAAIVFGVQETLLSFDFLEGRTPLLFLVLNAVFVVFDIGVSRVIAFYMGRLYPKIHK